MEKIILPDSCKFISAFLTFRCFLDCSYCVNNVSNEKFEPGEVSFFDDAPVTAAETQSDSDFELGDVLILELK